MYRLGLLSSVCFLLALPAQQCVAADDDLTVARPDFSGVWRARRGYGLRMTLPGGETFDGQRVIPLQPWAREEAILQRRLESEGIPPPNNNQQCLPPGLIRQYKGPFPFMILQTEEKITWLFEENYRVVQAFFGAQHPAPGELQPSWYGDSVAHWDGDTLVIETIGTNGKTTFPSGIKHTHALRIKHHMRLIDDRNVLEDRVRLEDPIAYKAPWEVVTLFDRESEDVKLREAVCSEFNQHLESSAELDQY